MMQNKDVKLKFQVFIPTFSGKGGYHTEAPNCETIDLSKIIDYSKKAEKLNYDAVYVCDHLMYGKDDAVLDPWITLSAIASATSKIKIGLWVTNHSIRHPAVTAKLTSTLDVYSAGRLILGYGAGWYKREYESLGFRFKPLEERISDMMEGIEIIKKLWTEDVVNYDGKFYKIKNARCNPKPIQKPHPLIMIGTKSNFGLRVVAKHADIWDFAGLIDPDYLNDRLMVLKNFCEEVSRNIENILINLSVHSLVRMSESEIRKFLDSINHNTIWHITSKIPPYVDAEKVEKTMVGTPSELTKRIEKCRALGFSSFNLIFIDYPLEESLELFSYEVMPQFKKD
jgi:alkanesulfonate monooxygenase SsuD/methylene tetrahydromethanopterin reductase-like flavin-dependent oxidoreductase (luciferase family)